MSHKHILPEGSCLECESKGIAVAAAAPSVPRNEPQDFEKLVDAFEFACIDFGRFGDRGESNRLERHVDAARSALMSAIGELKVEHAAKSYDVADMKKLGEWAQTNLSHHAGLSWSEGIAREFASLKSQLSEARKERDAWVEREAAVCPEDFSFEEVIASLEKQLADAREVVEAARGVHGNWDTNSRRDELSIALAKYDSRLVSDRDTP